MEHVRLAHISRLLSDAVTVAASISSAQHCSATPEENHSKQRKMNDKHFLPYYFT